MSQKNELIIRVKRKRSVNPTDTLVVEDDIPRKRHSSLLNQMTLLSTTNERKKITLHRISTVDFDQSQGATVNDIDLKSIELLQQIRNGDSFPTMYVKEQIETMTKSCEKSIWKTISKKVVKSNENESFVVVDVSQVNYLDQTLSPPLPSTSVERTSRASTNNSNRKKATKIINPFTKQLDKELENAYMTGQLSTVLDLIRQGADVNYQRTAYDGATALMIAAFYGNTKNVSSLLARGADATLLDKNALSALDYVMEGRLKHVISSYSASNEVAILLQQAISSKQMASSITSPSEVSTQDHNSHAETHALGDASNDMTEGQNIDEGDSEYAMDIFAAVVDSEVPSNIQQEATNTSNTAINTAQCNSDDVVDDGANALPKPPKVTSSASCPQNSASSSQDYSIFPVLQIPGLHVTDNGSVELMFEYDSDWSDLGDDEDPDSNDERFFGNDYPEDEDDDEGEGWRGFRNEGGDGDGEEGDDGSYCTDDDFEALPKFERRGVGRVVHPSTVDAFAAGDGVGGDYGSAGVSDEFVQMMYGDVNLKSQSSNRHGTGANGHFDADCDDNDGLYGEGYGDGEGDGEGMIGGYGGSSWGGQSRETRHSERLEDMAMRTGLHVTSLRRELNSVGLPKFGRELSDDENDITYTNGYGYDSGSGSGNGFGQDDWKPPKDTVAFDDELDCVSDNDYDMT